MRVITGSNFHKRRFPRVFCSFLLPDHVKEKQKIIDKYNTIEVNFLVFCSVHLHLFGIVTTWKDFLIE